MSSPFWRAANVLRINAIREAAKKRVQRALEKLRRLLARYQHTDSPVTYALAAYNDLVKLPPRAFTVTRSAPGRPSN